MPEETGGVSFFIAFSAGLLSFVSPCVLPLIPSYISYITGLSLDELTETGGRARARAVVVQNSLMFIAGFSAIFIFFGVSATVVGQFFLSHQAWIRRLGGLLIIFFGLYTMGMIKPAFLMRDARVHLQEKPAGLLGSFLVGVAFGAGWTPCVGPILGTILLYASSAGSVSTGVWLLSAYSMGLGLPLFFSSLGIQTFLGYFKHAKRHLRFASAVTGVFLVGIGILLMTNSLTRLTAFFSQVGIGWTIGQ